MSGVTGLITLEINARLYGAADLGNPLAPVRVSERLNLVPGTDAGENDILWADTRALSASTPEELDVAGTLTGLLGGTVTPAEITAIYLKVNSGTVAFFGADTAAFDGPLGGTTPTLTLGAGDWCMLTRAAGWTVTGGSVDKLKADPGGAAANYTIALIGRSVAA